MRGRGHHQEGSVEQVLHVQAARREGGAPRSRGLVRGGGPAAQGGSGRRRLTGRGGGGGGACRPGGGGGERRGGARAAQLPRAARLRAQRG